MSKDKDSESNFVGGAMVGVKPTSTPAEASPAVITRRRRKGLQVREDGAVIGSHETRKTEARLPSEQLDPTATIMSRDLFDRPLEIHTDLAWEGEHGIERVFGLGEVLWLVMCISLNDPYIQATNSPEFLAELAGVLPQAPGTARRAPRVYVPSYQYRVVVREHQPNTTVTIGLCPLYPVEIVDGPAKGLRFLAFPSDLMTKDYLDGYGINRILRRVKDGFKAPPGFEGGLTANDKEESA
jgi:hypothetical protein